MKDIYEIVDEYFGDFNLTKDYEHDTKVLNNVVELGDFVTHYAQILANLTRYNKYSSELTPRRMVGRRAKEICLDIINAIDCESETDIVAEYMAERYDQWDY